MLWTPGALTELADALADELPSEAEAPATLADVVTFNDLQAMAVEALHSAAEMQAEIVSAAKTLIATRPVFRSKPVGFEGSAARLQQQDEVAAEDALIAAIAKAAPAPADPRDPDPSREGLFKSHNCARCQSGAKPCVNGSPSRCDQLIARND